MDVMLDNEAEMVRMSAKRQADVMEVCLSRMLRLICYFIGTNAGKRPR